MKTLRKIYKIKRKINSHPQRILKSKLSYNNRDISCISFFNCGLVHFLINIYSNSSQLALKYLKDTEVNISSILIITGDFNIRDSIWDPDFPHYQLYSNILFEVVDFLYLELFKPTEHFLIRYSDN